MQGQIRLAQLPLFVLFEVEIWGKSQETLSSFPEKQTFVKGCVKKNLSHFVFMINSQVCFAAKLTLRRHSKVKIIE